MLGRGLGLGLVLVMIVSYCLGRVFYSVWWKPKRIERHLKQQGIKGTSYNLLYGDLNHMKHSTAEALSKPMSLSHQILPRVYPFLHQIIQTHGKLSLMWFGMTPRLLVAEPELMKQILTDKNDHFRKPPLNPLVELLTLGISALDGEEWAKRRKMITPAFHQEKIQGMFPSFLVSCANLIKRWEERVGESESMELDVAPEFQDLAADVIARAAFGSSLEEGKRIFELQKEQVVLVIEASLAVYVPGLKFVPTKKNRRRYEIDNEVKKMLRDLIRKKETAMKMGDQGGGDDLLSLLIQCRKGNDFTMEDLIEECKLFYFAGHETTATLLTWTLILLSLHPDWQNKAREEVLMVYGKKNSPDLESLSYLKIVSQILHEVQRLYPSVTGLFRHTCKTTKIGNIYVPPGVDIFLATIFLHHDPEYWGEDVAEFKPERFAEGVSKASKDGQAMAFYPFGWGPRFCLGQSFALVEAKLALAMVLQNFWFELSPSYAHAPFTIITLQPQHGAPLILHRL